MSTTPAANEAAAAWLRNWGHKDVNIVENMTAESWEMNDTDACGCDRFEVRIQWLGADGQRHWEYVEGSVLKSLWNWMTRKPEYQAQP